MEPADDPVSFDEFRRRVRGAPLSFVGPSPARRTFALRMDCRRLDTVTVTHVVGGDHTVERHDPAANDEDEPGSSRMVQLQLDGSSTLDQNGRTAVLRHGDIGTYTSSRPFTVRHRGEAVILRAHKDDLGLPDSLVDALVGVRLERERPLVAALSPLARQLTGLSVRDPSVCSRMVRAAITLFGAVAIETGRHLGHPVRRTELDAVLRYIEDNLPRPDLSVAEIATANFMSVRKLHALFESEDTTVAAWVRSRRLHYCRQDLADVAFTDVTIAEIAARWGFKDAAHFSRAFADRFGVTARTFRAAAHPRAGRDADGRRSRLRPP